jgi:hypothetical protein
MDPQLEAFLRSRIHNPDTLERVLRANRDTASDQMARGVGWRRSQELRDRCMSAMLVRKGAAIRRYGRRIWEMVPRSQIERHGKREAAQYQMLEFVLKGVPEGREEAAAAVLRMMYPSRHKRVMTVELIEAWDRIKRRDAA